MITVNNIRRKANGLPVLSYAELDALGERLAGDFAPECLQKPQPLDIEALTELYLGLRLDFQYLSCCGKYLGMTVFRNTNKIIVYDPVKACADYLSARAGTVILDTTLLPPRQRHRFRFTLAHEAAGHALLHGAYFAKAQDNPRCQENPLLYATGGKWQDYNWLEWQADTMSSTLLMPRSPLRLLINTVINSAAYLNLPVGERPFYLTAQVATTFEVSFTAAKIRLKYVLGRCPKPRQGK